MVAMAAAALLAACGSDHHATPKPTPSSSDDAALGQAAGSASTATPSVGPGSTVDGVHTSVACPTGGSTVSNAAELRSALAQAGPGTVIHLAAGVYSGAFAATRSGTSSAPIYLCGSRSAVIDGGAKTKYDFYLNHASWWRAIGFTVRGGQKGVVADGVSHDIIGGLSVSGTGDEAIHLRSFSSDNVVIGNTVRDTGSKSAKFGEGIYVGSAKSNWCTYSHCDPDTSNGNSIIGNNVADTTAENIDIKEGTTGGLISGNRLSSAGMVQADSLIDVKGNSWTVIGNIGSGGGSLVDGIQTHVILKGWGDRDIFAANRLSLGSSGYGINVNKKSSGTVVHCNNVASGARKGLSNLQCSGT